MCIRDSREARMPPPCHQRAEEMCSRRFTMLGTTGSALIEHFVYANRPVSCASSCSVPYGCQGCRICCRAQRMLRPYLPSFIILTPCAPLRGCSIICCPYHVRGMADGDDVAARMLTDRSQPNISSNRKHREKALVGKTCYEPKSIRSHANCTAAQ